ncbi:MAG TPA: NAD+ synthase [Streptosporangiaceae bacterium]|nr:NAD+ synthase [Streptosporangiaceae bacterium]
MPQIRIALAQVNSTVGDLDGNHAAVMEWTAKAAGASAAIVVFPEMMLTGYPVEDLALRASFVDASIAALGRTASQLADAGLGDIAVVLGYLDRKPGLQPRVGLPHGAPLDAAAVLYGGTVVVRSAKHHLPNYGVFDEFRYFVPGDVLPVVRLEAGDGGLVDVAVAVCEDLWQDGGPVAVTKQAGASLLVVPNASPYERGKGTERVELCLHRGAEAGAALAYVNMVGGQDELVFDGDSVVIDTAGAVVARGPQFEQALVVTDLELPAADPALPDGDVAADAGDGTIMIIRRVTLSGTGRERAGRGGPGSGGPGPGRPGRGGQAGEAAADVRALWPRLEDLAEVYSALVLGVRDYVRKNGFSSVILALSGGIDSALTATIAADAIGAEQVHVVLMPSKYSSSHSLTDAEDLVKRQGVQARTVPIAAIVGAFDNDLRLSGLAEENLQARVRGMIAMSLSNADGHLVLTTGNKSELATGYSTLYGDSAGGFAPIKDVPKTLVWELAKWRNRQAEQAGEEPPIPENSITKPPSAELSPGQLDSDSLPGYEELDAILDDYVEKDLGAAELLAAGHDPQVIERVIGLVDRAEYKRRQYPPGPKISAKNFGRDRRLPITNRWREPLPR